MANLYFLNHPDGEPGYHKRTIGAMNVHSWNVSGRHWRKFINRRGVYIDKMGNLINDSLYFWGEYEPYSVSTFMKKSSPKAIHSDLKEVRLLPPMPNGALNSDPYVYGYFRNICCRRYGHDYKPGDVLVFGTMDVAANTISIDTVIVVKDICLVSSLNHNGQYYLAAVKPLNNPKDYIEGVIYNKGIQYYSFVPCLPAGKVKGRGTQKHIHAASSFHKPILALNSFGAKTYIKSRFRGKGCNPVPFLPAHWNMLINAVQSVGLEIGTNIQLIGKSTQQ